MLLILSLTLTLNLWISKKHFRQGGMAASVWMPSIRAISDTPVANYSVPGINCMCRIQYWPPVAVSPFLLALSVFNLKQTLWCCGQLWQYIGIGTVGTSLHQDCNALGDTAKISPHVPSTCRQNAILLLLIIHIMPTRQIYMSIDCEFLVPSDSSHTTSSYLSKYIHVANNVSHAETLQSNGCRCFSHL